MYSTILIPLENSPADETILTHIRPLARMANSQLILIHVADGYVARYQDQLDLEESDEIRKDRAYLERRANELRQDGLNVATRLACGEPAGQILAAAKTENCDLIAMTTHGHGFIKDVILGTVAEQVRHRTDIPVLLVRSDWLK